MPVTAPETWAPIFANSSQFSDVAKSSDALVSVVSVVSVSSVSVVSSSVVVFFGRRGFGQLVSSEAELSSSPPQPAEANTSSRSLR